MINKRFTYIAISVIALIALYVFQRFNYSALISTAFTTNTQFIINKTIRFFFNDLAVILLIYAIYNNKQLLKISFSIQLFEMLIILPLYFYVILIKKPYL